MNLSDVKTSFENAFKARLDYSYYIDTNYDTFISHVNSGYKSYIYITGYYYDWTDQGLEFQVTWKEFQSKVFRQYKNIRILENTFLPWRNFVEKQTSRTWTSGNRYNFD